uniref:Uncharacterized protein n=1 Tax=Strombidium rassoulzadegani TaxID=1082188 RepID=A0A7S3FUQ3_9SPIT|mmetsp:Transcript_13801/g.23539  ORF Transcript_13801/g.23539 Transcript_13801/m.23539 type:complete len:224 (+) Transcript_13801:74-745(+)
MRLRLLHLFHQPLDHLSPVVTPLVALEGHDQVLYLKDVAEDVVLKEPVVHHEAQVVLHRDLLPDLPSLSEGLPHDGDQHVQQVHDHDEGRDREEGVEWHLLSASLEAFNVHIPNDELVVDVPHGPPVGGVGDVGSLTIREVVEVDLVLADEVEGDREAEAEDEKDDHEVPDVEEDLLDLVDDLGEGVEQTQEVSLLQPQNGKREGLQISLTLRYSCELLERRL